MKNNSKIGILTQPLHDNYGGLLQAYALKTTLERLGHDVDIINRRKDTVSLAYKVKKLIKKIIGKEPKFEPNKLQKKAISKHTNYFAEKYIKHITSPIYNTEGLKNISEKYNTFVIGSDQVWRPAYSPKISNYYLDFAEKSNVKGIAYAASFGVDTWEYSEEDSKLCKKNIHKIQAISVREDSAIKLCKENLGVDAIHVIDPTLLLDKKDYIDLINNESVEKLEGNLMHYVLDSSKDKEDLINKVAEFYKLKIFTAHQKKKPGKEKIINIEDFIFPKVTTWLKGFYKAEFIITDSFHGTVFSILFNKPFLAVANIKRGKSRFESLLKMFDLEDRLILDAKKIDIETIKSLRPIEWNAVNQILSERREIAMNFLKSNL